jgi:hypothetical protein
MNDDAKRVRALHKKLRQAMALREEHSAGKELDEEQHLKVLNIPPLQQAIRELEGQAAAATPPAAAPPVASGAVSPPEHALLGSAAPEPAPLTETLLVSHKHHVIGLSAAEGQASEAVRLQPTAAAPPPRAADLPAQSGRAPQQPVSAASGSTHDAHACPPSPSDAGASAHGAPTALPSDMDSKSTE